jgi:hypothetical protein
MTEEEWYKLGDKKLAEWVKVVEESIPGYETSLTANEESAFEYAWELAGREMGIVK